MRSFVISNTKFCSSDHFEKNEICGSRDIPRNAYRVLVGKPEETIHFESLDVDRW